jgi:hypothetical protein
MFYVSVDCGVWYTTLAVPSIFPGHRTTLLYAPRRQARDPARTAQSPERRSTEGAAFGFACAMWGCRCAILLLYGEVVLSRSPGYQAPGATQPEVRVNARRAAPLGRCSRSGSWSVQISSRPDGKTAPVDSAFCFWPRQRRQPSLLGGAAGWCPPPPPRSLRRLGSARRGEGRPLVPPTSAPLFALEIYGASRLPRFERQRQRGLACAGTQGRAQVVGQGSGAHPCEGSRAPRHFAHQRG